MKRPGQWLRVLSLLAVAIAGTVRGRAWRIAVMGVAFGLYWATLALGELNTNLAPSLSVWAPNIVFSAIALLLIKVTSGRGYSRSVEPGSA